jgi:di/tricarboxylate transporter
LVGPGPTDSKFGFSDVQIRDRPYLLIRRRAKILNGEQILQILNNSDDSKQERCPSSPATAPQAFETFSRSVVFLILASLFLAEALRKHGLTRRLALGIIMMSRGGVGALLFGLMSISALFSMWVGNTATAAMPIPVALTISRQVSEKDKAEDLLAMLALGIAYSASLGGMVTILGAAAMKSAVDRLADDFGT